MNLGHVSDGELRWLYANCDGFIAASRYEGFDLPVLEALANGATVLASDIDVHRELFREAVELFSSERELAALLGARPQGDSSAREVCLEKYSWDRSAETLEVILEEAVARS